MSQQRDPHLQRLEAPAELRSHHPEVDPVAGALLVLVDVGGHRGERDDQVGRFPHQDAASGVRRVHPLVWVEGDRVGALDPSEERTKVVGQHGRPSVGRVDVEPQAFFLADPRDLLERVDGPCGHRPGRANHGEGEVSGLSVRADGLAERAGPDAEVPGDGDLPDGVVAEPQHVGGPVGGHVDLLRGVQDERRPGGHAAVTDVPGSPVVSGRLERHEVRQGPAGDQQAAGR